MLYPKAGRFPFEFVCIVAQFLAGIGGFSYKVIRSNDSLCRFNKQEHNGCTADRVEHFGHLKVTRSSTNTDMQLKEMTRFTAVCLCLI